ncbi:G-type lectin S-receptor-like serine/threonine-protein kinase At2g19130 [Camellia sinensis]|uniref:G-type lectin S-receptor-like serine/threonine-protein kinase At2g19130 n=1 Tax=Camellia sinensis TaxID=4442 RepID=UPI001036B65D|nr:G-type lectin S-receptor-like serine/threonine-protein kinase At2g19130 [Camellia sinensis]
MTTGLHTEAKTQTSHQAEASGKNKIKMDADPYKQLQQAVEVLKAEGLNKQQVLAILAKTVDDIFPTQTESKSSNYHICIWYTKVSTQTIVWVANKDIPIFDKYSSELRILDGNLVLLNESQTPTWSTNQNSTTSNFVVAVIGDDGNLILKDGFNSTQPIWKSFDYLVHTWLPGSKISYNKRANTHQSITWKNYEDPSPGLFSHVLDANNSYLLLWNGSK